ncbi:MAG: cytochrome c maturation protein CcmE [Ekhidna sp.]|uniref:cytochrome c maturation protein CcmE domain-containing protein n=1 Tax=Ekhidna sp. TaxID=2608089 RepID=UPI0032EB4FE8
MKKKYIAAIIIIAVAITMIVSMTGDASTYVTFEEAKVLSEKGFKKSIHVVGELPKTASGQVVGIEESPDKLSFKFEMVDEKGMRQQVLFAEPIPTDFTRSEQVVIVGAYQGDKFVAEKILLKCPSKYQEEPEFNS